MMEIKDDKGMRFWQDKWCLAAPLDSLFRLVYSQTEDSARPVSAHWSKNGWNIQVHYLVQLQYEDQKEELLQLLP